MFCVFYPNPSQPLFLPFCLLNRDLQVPLFPSLSGSDPREGSMFRARIREKRFGREVVGLFSRLEPRASCLVDEEFGSPCSGRYFSEKQGFCITRLPQSRLRRSFTLSSLGVPYLREGSVDEDDMGRGLRTVRESRLASYAAPAHVGLRMKSIPFAEIHLSPHRLTTSFSFSNQ